MVRRASRRRLPLDLWLGAAMTLVVVVAGAAAPWLAPRPAAEQLLEARLEPPGLGRSLGRDELGRDILSRLLWGARISVTVGLAVVLLAGTLGTAIGCVSGYRGGVTDSLCMRLADVVFAFPGILLAISLVAVLGPALEHVVVALVAIGWAGYARLARGQAMKLRQQEYVAAATATGLSTSRILARHVLPNLLPVMLVQAALGMAGAILAEAGLSFLGLGVQPPAASWGAMINAGRSHLIDAPHLALFPGLAILWTVVGLNLLADGLIDVLDPRQRLALSRKIN